MPMFLGLAELEMMQQSRGLHYYKLVMCASKPPTVISILNCTGHMVDGGRKDAEFIISFYKSKVDAFYPGKTLTDTLFFDETATFQKTGQIPCVHFQGQCVSM